MAVQRSYKRLGKITSANVSCNEGSSVWWCADGEMLFIFDQYVFAAHSKYRTLCKHGPMHSNLHILFMNTTLPMLHAYMLVLNWLIVCFVCSLADSAASLPHTGFLSVCFGAAHNEFAFYFWMATEKEFNAVLAVIQQQLLGHQGEKTFKMAEYEKQPAAKLVAAGFNRKCNFYNTSAQLLHNSSCVHV